MFPLVDTRSLPAVRRACLACCPRLPGDDGHALWLSALDWLEEAFSGRNPDYEQLDTPYHDLEHTLQATLCLARILGGWSVAGAQPHLTPRGVRLAMVAMLFHDTGYLKARGDRIGTGAKFTQIHVQRSAAFAQRRLAVEGLADPDIQEIQKLIRCTGTNGDAQRLEFESPLHRRLGCSLATADFLGQMAAPDYVDKLPKLFAEFAEAAAHPFEGEPRVPLFQDAAELARCTPTFWAARVRPALDNELEGIYRLLETPPFPGPNEYLARTETNIARIFRSTHAAA